MEKMTSRRLKALCGAKALLLELATQTAKHHQESIAEDTTYTDLNPEWDIQETSNASH